MPESADKDLQLEVFARECGLTLRAACFSLHLKQLEGGGGGWVSQHSHMM